VAQHPCLAQRAASRKRIVGHGAADDDHLGDLNVLIGQDMRQFALGPGIAPVPRPGGRLQAVFDAEVAARSAEDRGGRVRPLAAAGTARDTALAGLKLALVPSEHPKCVRCWHHRDSVGQCAEHPQLCDRCVSNVAGGGERRNAA